MAAATASTATTARQRHGQAASRRQWTGQVPTSRAQAAKVYSGAKARTSESTQRATHSFLTGRSPRTHRRGNHSVAVAAQYIACMVMILLSAGLGGKSSTEEVLAAPIVVMVRLSAVTLLFFALALLSTGEQLGRLAAAFGALVTLGVGLNASNEWKTLAGIFSPPKAKA